MKYKLQMFDEDLAKTITFEFETVYLPDLIGEFEAFILAAGFHPNGSLGIIEDNEDDDFEYQGTVVVDDPEIDTSGKEENKIDEQDYFGV